MAISAGAIRAAQAFVEMTLDDRKLQKGLDGTLAKIQGVGASVGKLGVGMAGAGAAILAPFGLAISQASDFQETLGKFDVVFAENSKAVRAWGEDFAKTVGRSKGDILSFLSSSQDLLVPLGIDPKSAEETSKQLTKLTVDLASFNNMAEADVMRDLQAALTGSGEVTKKYGVIVSEATVKQELINQKMDPKTATEAEKAMARLNIIMRGTTAAQGDALRTSDSFANKMRALQAIIKDAGIDIGTVLLPAVTDLVTELIDIAKPTALWISQNETLIKVVAGVGAGLIAIGGPLAALGASAVLTSKGIVTLRLALTTLQSGSVAARAGLAGLAVAGILAVAYAVYQANPAIREFNRQLGLSKQLADSLNDAQRRRRNNILADIASLGTEEDKQKAINEQLAQNEKEIKGVSDALKRAEQEVKRLEEGNFFDDIGIRDKDLVAARKEVEEVTRRLEEAKNFSHELRDALLQSERTDRMMKDTAKGLPDVAAATKELQEAQDSLKNMPTFEDIAAGMNAATASATGSGPGQMAAQQVTFDDDMRNVAKEQLSELRQIQRNTQNMNLSFG